MLFFSMQVKPMQIVYIYIHESFLENLYTKISCNLLCMKELVKNKIQCGQLLKTIIIPNEKNVKFFKHSRRQTADLAVANLAIGFKKLSDKKIDDVQIFIGGIGIAIKDCPQRNIVKADHLEHILTESNIDEVTQESIYTAVEEG